MKRDTDAPHLARNSRKGTSLGLRLTLAVALIAAAGLTVSAVVHYLRERQSQISILLNHHEEQVQMLILARSAIPDNRAFSTYVNRVCDKMHQDFAPGYHVLVLNHDNTVLVNAVEHSGPEVTKALMAARDRRGVVPIGSRELSYVMATDKSGTRYLIGQYCDPIQKALEAEILRRVLIAVLIEGALVAVILLVVKRWVLSPLGELSRAESQWSRRDFSARARASGPKEFRALANDFNSMTAEIEHTEHLRHAELERAQQIQKDLLPATLPPMPGLEVTGLFRPVESVAGDLYDVFPLADGCTGISIVDVAGHGISAALLTGVVKMSIQHRVAECRDLSEVIRLVNQDLMRCSGQGVFVTACVGIWNPADRTWTYVAAGHLAGVLMCRGDADTLFSTGALLGVMADAEWETEVLALHDADRVLLFTDGVSSAGEPVDPMGPEGILRILREAPSEPLARQMTLILEDALRRSSLSPVSRDDITMVEFEVLPGTQPGQFHAV